MKYYQQAFEHLTNAFKQNSSLVTKSEEAKQYHSSILTLLGRCYTDGGEVDDALELLDKSLKMNKAIMGEEDYSNCAIHIITARAYIKKEKYEEAIKEYLIVWEYVENKFGIKSREIADVFLELADAYDKNEERKEAVEFQRRALEIYKGTKDVDKKRLAAIAENLGEMYSHNEMINEAITTLREVETIYNNIYGKNNRQARKVKRSISLLLIKINNYEESLKELIEIEVVLYVY